MNNIKPIEINGRSLWVGEDIGPRGGVRKYYADRCLGDAAPTGWELWSRTAKDAGGSISPAGTFGLSPMGLGH